MDSQVIRPPLLASIPDISNCEQKAVQLDPPSSSGRVFGQLLSFKLLAVVTALLVIVAVVPKIFQKSEPTVKTAAETEALPAWNPGHSMASSDSTDKSAAEKKISRTDSPTSVLPTPTIQQTVAASPTQVNNDQKAESPMMSTWPNPSHPVLAGADSNFAEPRTGVNQAMAITPSSQVK